MSLRRRVLGWVLVAFLVALSLVASRRGPGPERVPSLAMRLLGPVSSVAASVQWVRVYDAIRQGRTDKALARARVAIELDPGETSGWVLLASHLGYGRASVQLEPSGERRLAWVRAALQIAAEGERRARDPSRLARWQGLLLGKLAQDDEPVPWPGGVRGLWSEAAEHFERSAALGDPDGAALAEAARRRADEAAATPSGH